MNYWNEILHAMLGEEISTMDSALHLSEHHAFTL